jgi:hypothetical protein
MLPQSESGDVDALRCPVCGIGVLSELSYDQTGGDDGEARQTPSARELTAYSCGHEVPGQALATADPERLDVERRRTEETVDPPPDRAR